jgi:TetR/AcrR family transcriptional regulator, transcriptional repressor for nem operon
MSTPEFKYKIMKTLSAKGTATRDHIIRVAADLFHKQGIRATSPDEIIEASDTGKGQFYHYFRSKEGLVHAVLEWHAELIRKGEAPIDYDIQSWRDLEKWLFAHVELQKEFGMTRGCPFGTAANDITADDELIRQDLCVIFDLIKSRIAAFFVKEKALGHLIKEAKEEQLADYCIATVQGAMLLGKVHRDSNVGEGVVRETLAHLRQYHT